MSDVKVALLLTPLSLNLTFQINCES